MPNTNMPRHTRRTIQRSAEAPRRGRALRAAGESARAGRLARANAWAPAPRAGSRPPLRSWPRPALLRSAPSPLRSAPTPGPAAAPPRPTPPPAPRGGGAAHPVLQMGKLSLSKVRPRSRTQVRPGGEGLRFGGWGLPSRGRSTFPPQHLVRDVGLPAGPPGKAFPSSGQVVGRAPPPPLTTISPLALCLASHTLMLWLPASDGCELGSLPGNAECEAAGLGHGARTALKAPPL